MKKIAIQGYSASFHDQAARQFFGEDIEIVPCDTFKDTFEAVEIGRADQAVVAIENSLYGSINEVYDLLLKKHFSIVGEIYLRIEHFLIGLPGTKLEDIREVHSHPVALAQCEDFLDTVLAHAERFEHHDTAESVADIKKWNDSTRTAVAGRAAAKLHGMEVLAENIETHHENYTRFVVLSKTKSSVVDPNKTSFILKTAEKPGALYAALGVFAKRTINLTKLQSRPVIGEAWRYMFYIDAEIGAQSSEFKQALDELKAQSCETIVLGSYKSGR